LISIPVTNTSVNPARSTGVAIFQGTWALQQLWMFWVVPLIGGAVGGLIFRHLLSEDATKPSLTAAAQPGVTSA
jgi:aquaporin Z